MCVGQFIASSLPSKAEMLLASTLKVFLTPPQITLGFPKKSLTQIWPIATPTANEKSLTLFHDNVEAISLPEENQIS